MDFDVYFALIFGVILIINRPKFCGGKSGRLQGFSINVRNRAV
jgi:hypothetical protein